MVVGVSITASPTITTITNTTTTTTSNQQIHYHGINNQSVNDAKDNDNYLITVRIS